jgi:ribosomal protein S12
MWDHAGVEDFNSCAGNVEDQSCVLLRRTKYLMMCTLDLVRYGVIAGSFDLDLEKDRRQDVSEFMYRYFTS